MSEDNGPDPMTLAAQIVSAYASNNVFPASELPALIQSMVQALTVSEAVPAAVAREPAVPPKESVFPGHLVCLDCGRKMVMLKGHLFSKHGLTPQQYRARWGLPGNYPITAPDHSKLRGVLAKEHHLGVKGHSHV